MNKSQATIIRAAEAEAARMKQGSLKTTPGKVSVISANLHRIVASGIDGTEVQQLDELLQVWAVVRGKIDELLAHIAHASETHNVHALRVIEHKLTRLAMSLPNNGDIQKLREMLFGMVNAVNTSIRDMAMARDPGEVEDE